MDPAPPGPGMVPRDPRMMLFGAKRDIFEPVRVAVCIVVLYLLAKRANDVIVAMLKSFDAANGQRILQEKRRTFSTGEGDKVT